MSFSFSSFLPFFVSRDQRECPVPVVWDAQPCSFGRSACSARTTQRSLSWPYRSAKAHRSPCIEMRSSLTWLQESTTFRTQELLITPVRSQRSVRRTCCIMLWWCFITVNHKSHSTYFPEAEWFTARKLLCQWKNVRNIFCLFVVGSSLYCPVNIYSSPFYIHFVWYFHQYK